MNSIKIAVVAGAVLLSACTTMSGPRYWANEVTLADGSQAYRVLCAGILNSSEACYRQARKICGRDEVNIATFDNLRGKHLPKEDPRELVFVCGDLPAAAPETRLSERIVTQDFRLQSDALFEFGRAELTEQAKARLDEFSGAMAGVDIRKMRIIGHTDSVGSRSGNQKLSEDRAKSVHSYLQFLGIKADSVVVEGRGKDEPIAPNDTAEGRATNRRVDIRIEGGGESREVSEVEMELEQ